MASQPGGSGIRTDAESGSALSPGYTAMAEYLRGNAGDAEQFALESLRRIKGEDGLEIYLTIAAAVPAAHRGERFFEATRFEYERLRDALTVVEKRHPNQPEILQYPLFFACHADDLGTARRRLFPLVGDQVVPELFPPAQYERFLAWSQKIDAKISGQHILKGHVNPVSSVAFSADGSILATTAPDPGASLRLWARRIGRAAGDRLRSGSRHFAAGGLQSRREMAGSTRSNRTEPGV